MLRSLRMESPLDYSKLVWLDAECLAECGIKAAYESFLPELRLYVAEPAQIQEVIDPSVPSYLIRCQGIEYRISSPELADDEGQSWGRAGHAFFKIVNDQLASSEYRFFAINGGNDLGGMFLTQSELEGARRSIPRPEDWPYLPTIEHSWYGQSHS